MSHPVPARAKEPTPQEAEQRRDDMHALNEGIKQTVAEGRRALWKLAAQLALWDEETGWSALGYESQNEWLADPAIGISRGRFRDLVDTYRYLQQREIPEQEMARLEYTKVRTVLPAVRQHRTYLEDALGDAKALGSQALREKYRGASGAASGEVVDQAGRPAYEPEPVDPGDIEVADHDGEPIDVEPVAHDESEGTATEVDTEKSAQKDAPTSGHLSEAEPSATICESCRQPIPGEAPR